MASQETVTALPRHVAIIMDGNGRWASMRNLPRAEGHRAGARAVREIVSRCRELGIEYLTLYAFSSENWNRPKAEIAALFNLLVEFLRIETPLLVEKQICLHVLGNIDGLPLPQRTALKRAIARTADCSGMHLNLALNYGGRAEIIRAIRSWASQGADVAELDENSFKKYLYTATAPDPDFLIRTSGELRLSNFLLYQCAYSELYFTSTWWPDFNAQELDKALADYARRQRRFGKTGDQLQNNGENAYGS